MSNRAKELDFLRLKEKQFNIRKSFITTNASLQDMECSRQHYNTKIFRGCQCQWQSLALDKRGTCTCTGRVTAQGNKDTMTTMVVVIVDDGDHHLDHDETSPCVGD